MRRLGHDDKRKIYFNLTEEGRRQLEKVKALNIDVPDLIRPILDSSEDKRRE